MQGMQVESSGGESLLDSGPLGTLLAVWKFPGMRDRVVGKGRLPSNPCYFRRLAFGSVGPRGGHFFICEIAINTTTTLSKSQGVVSSEIANLY